MNLQHDKEIAYTPPCQEQRYIGHGPKKNETDYVGLRWFYVFIR